jgi:hypothetical protein
MKEIVGLNNNFFILNNDDGLPGCNSLLAATHCLAECSEVVSVCEWQKEQKFEK